VTGNLASPPAFCNSRWMRCNPWLRGVSLLVVLLSVRAEAAVKVHAISFGKWTSVPWLTGSSTNNKPEITTIRIRALIVDGRVKEYVLGLPHDVTDRLFVVRRVFRLNDSLPEDVTPRWQWQRGGWLTVDRTTGRVAPISLPEFDAFYSAASWYRDYVAYCGVSDDGKTTYAVVAQIGRRKPVLKKALSSNGLTDDAAPDSACASPAWQRGPARVSFEPTGVTRQTFAIRGHFVDLVDDAEEDEDAEK
jgi:hypothetical protein